MPGKPARAPHKAGGDDPVGEVLGQAFDGGACHAGRIQACRVAANDMGDGSAALREPGAQTVLHGADVLPQATLGEQGGRQDCERGESERARQPGQDGRLQRRGCSGGDDQQGCEREHAGRPAHPAIERAVQPCDAVPGPGDRVADGAEQNGRVAERGLDQQGGGDDGERGGQAGNEHERHGRGLAWAGRSCMAAACWRRGGISPKRRRRGSICRPGSTRSPMP